MVDLAKLITVAPDSLDPLDVGFFTSTTLEILDQLPTIGNEEAVRLISELAKTDPTVLELVLQAVAAAGVGRYSDLFKTLGSTLDISDAQLQRYVDSATLLEHNVVPAAVHKSLGKLKTTFQYRQQKYNLVREDLQGYSKLIDKLLSKPAHIDMVIVTEIIGAFSLDPFKVLSIILDIMASNLDNYEEYLAFLETTSWWPAQLASPTNVDDNSGDSAGGSQYVAEILGFKLLHAQEWASVVSLAARLISNGVVSFDSIYAYIEPNDTSFEQFEQVWKAGIDKQAENSSPNALAMAAPLADDDDPATREPTPANVTAQTAVDADNTTGHDRSAQRLLLVQTLLSCGCVVPAMLVLSRFPFIAQANKEVASSLSGLILTTVNELDKTYGTAPEKKDTDGDVDMDDDVLFPCDELVRLYDKFALCGPLLGQNKELMSKLVGLGKRYYSQNPEFWHELTRLYLLSAISLTEDRATGDVVFELLKLFPHETRYTLYAEWQNVLPKLYPLVNLAAAKAKKETRDALKRISNTNVSEMMCKIAAASYANPLPTFAVFISQVESYDKIGSLIVESADALSDFGWDVLPFVIVTQLASGRDTQQRNGLYNRKWLQALARFSAQLSAKYSAFDIRPLLLYCLRQLHQGETGNILILNQLLYHMGGCIPLSNLTMEQIVQLSGSDLVKTLAYSALGAPANSEPQRLIDTVLELGIASELFVALSQGYNNVLHLPAASSEPSSKVLTHKLDDLVHTIQQYSHIISRFTAEEFAKLGLGVVDLHKSFGVRIPMAFSLWRPFLSAELRRAEPSENAMHPIFSSVAPIFATLPDSSQGYLSPLLFVTFWTLNTYDIFVSRQSYSLPASLRDDKDKALEFKKEKTRHVLHVNKTLGRLRGDQATWFPGAPKDCDVKDWTEKQMLEFLGQCILPRASFSPLDAFFAAQFIKVIRTLGTENFNVLTLLDVFFSSGALYGCLQTATAFELENIGIFTVCMLDECGRWGSSNRNYLKFALGKQNEPVQDHETVSAKETAHDLDNRERASTEPMASRDAKDADSEDQHESPRAAPLADGENGSVDNEDDADDDQKNDVDRDEGSEDHTHSPSAELSELNAEPDEAEPSFSDREASGSPMKLDEDHEVESPDRGASKEVETPDQGASVGGSEQRSFGPGDAAPNSVLATMGKIGTTFSVPRVSDMDSVVNYDQFLELLESWYKDLTSTVLACLRSESYIATRNAIVFVKAVINDFPDLATDGQTILEEAQRLANEDSREDIKLAATALIGQLQRRKPHWKDLITDRGSRKQGKEVRERKEPKNRNYGRSTREAQSCPSEEHKPKRQSNKQGNSRNQTTRPEKRGAGRLDRDAEHDRYNDRARREWERDERRNDGHRDRRDHGRNVDFPRRDRRSRGDYRGAMQPLPALPATPTGRPDRRSHKRHRAD